MRSLWKLFENFLYFLSDILGTARQLTIFDLRIKVIGEGILWDDPFQIEVREKYIL